MKWQKECPYCGKVYKSKRFYKLHIKKHKKPEILGTPLYETGIDESKIEKPKEVTRKIVKPKIKYREVVYLGTADQATIKGAVTDKRYDFFKDKYKMPISTKVDEKDYPSIIVLKGKGCARRDPTALYMSKLDWDLEIEASRTVNR